MLPVLWLLDWELDLSIPVGVLTGGLETPLLDLPLAVESAASIAATCCDATVERSGGAGVSKSTSQNSQIKAPIFEGLGPVVQFRTVKMVMDRIGTV
jgi:hypothetical protein